MLGVVPAALLGATWWWSAGVVDDARDAAHPVETAPPALPEVSAPVLSVRRSPTVLSADVSTNALGDSLDPVAAAMGAESCLVVADDRMTVFDAQGSLPVIPASNMKILTAAVALEVLGAERVFTTEIAGALDGDVVRGDLFLVGGGDPLLSVGEYPPSQTYPPFNTTSMEQLADRIVFAGVRRIEGGIVGDDSRYDDERYVPTWDSDIPDLEAGPLGALLVNDGRVYPRNALPGQDPAEAAAEQLQELLEQRGVSVGGPPRRGARDAAAPVIASIDSVPLSGVIVEMLETSDDNTAELLLKEIGLQASGAGTRPAGAAAVLATLTSWGVPVDGVVVTDGSGLDRGNRVPCTTMVAVLERADAGSPLYDGLPVAAVSGTLEGFFVDTPSAGRLRAKTGTLRQVKALSGYFDNDAVVPRFSFIINGQAAVDAWPLLWTDVGTALAAYPAGPDPAELAPG